MWSSRSKTWRYNKVLNDLSIYNERYHEQFVSATDWVNVFATNKSLVTLLYKKFLKNNKKDNPVRVFLNS